MLAPVPMLALVPEPVVAMLVVAVVPSAETAVIVVCGLIPPAEGPATNLPTSAAVNVPAAAVSVVAPVVHETPVIWRPLAGTLANVCVYVKVPVAVPSVEPTTAVMPAPIVGD